jgi:hypothetical protein
MTEATNPSPPPTIITLTLPTPENGGITPERATATLLIQRGDWAHIRQFHYAGMWEDINAAMFGAVDAIGLVEANPPTLPAFPEPPKPDPKRQPSYHQLPKPTTPEEPTISIPLKKGALKVKRRYVQIAGIVLDDEAIKQVMPILTKLIGGKLWDGLSPILITGMASTLDKLRFLSEKDLTMFSLTDFVQIGVDEPPPAPTDQTNDTPPASLHGHFSEEDAFVGDDDAQDEEPEVDEPEDDD